MRDGADALGMAGGDGSQAAVAAVAAEHDLPYVCVPAGTRNHFAFDLGIDRDDVVGALDAFVDGDERRIDLGRVNGRTFVNNVAMGVYGAVVQSPAYREHKVRTVIGMLPELVGPRAEPFDLRFTGGDGRAHDTAVLSSSPTTPTRSTPDRGTAREVSSIAGCSGSSPSPGRRRTASDEWASGDVARRLGDDGRARDRRRERGDVAAAAVRIRSAGARECRLPVRRTPRRLSVGPPGAAKGRPAPPDHSS